MFKYRIQIIRMHIFFYLKIYTINMEIKSKCYKINDNLQK